MPPPTMPLADLLYAACVLEATARKPGNVHPDASFSDLTYEDFVRSAQASAPVLAQASEFGVGQTIYAAVAATRKAVASNSNLGIILLLAPLAAVPRQLPLREGIGAILDGLTVDDAAWAYPGIRLAQPGGMGDAAEQDVSAEPSITLLEAMRLAADRDLIAQQYVSNFSLILNDGMRWLASNDTFGKCSETAIIRLQLHLLSAHPDSLISRKCGRTVAEEASSRARHILESGWPAGQHADEKLSEFDRWLRADGHRRNPGTTADLIAATLFAAFRDQVLPLPAFPG